MKKEFTIKERNEIEQIISSMLLKPVTSDLLSNKIEHSPVFILQGKITFLYMLLKKPTRRDLVKFIAQNFGGFNSREKSKGLFRESDPDIFFVERIKTNKEQFLKDIERVIVLLLIDQFKFYQFSDEIFREISGYSGSKIGIINSVLQSHYSAQITLKKVP